MYYSLEEYQQEIKEQNLGNDLAMFLVDEDPYGEKNVNDLIREYGLQTSIRITKNIRQIALAIYEKWLPA